MSGGWSSSDCAFCGKPTPAAPYAPPRTMLTYRDTDTGEQRRVQLPRTVTICESCIREVSLLAGCPRCRVYGKYPQYAHSPYGSFCLDCGGRLYLLSGEDPVR
ncbi:MAG TPA: hypothetical protein VF155_06610 [Candidatus Dormibacteraeota bacterium]